MMSNQSGKGSLGRKIRLAFILLCFVVLGILIFQNRDPVETRLLFSNVSMPLAALLFVTVSIGMLTGALMTWAFLSRRWKSKEN